MNIENRLFVTAAKGLENALLKELQALPLSRKESLKIARGGVQLEANLEDAYQICLWSRVASRVLLPIREFAAPTPEKLYGGVKSIRWSDHLDARRTLAVDFVTTESQITHGLFGAQKTKDAIVDQLLSVQGARPSVDLNSPDVRVSVYLNRDQATVSIDLSGDSLHRRGYREDGIQSIAPLKENLAAGILIEAGWPELCESGEKIAFVDPMCGSGTLLIEAALIAARIAPGSLRRKFGFHGWKKFDDGLWKRVTQDAIARERQDQARLPRIYGYDQSLRAVKLAQDHVANAGLESMIHVEKRSIHDWFVAPTAAAGEVQSASVNSAQTDSSVPTGSSGNRARDWGAPTAKGMIGCNPPYGERLGEEDELVEVYRELGDLLKKRFQGWTGFVFTGSPRLSKEVGLKAARRVPLFNGPIDSRLLVYQLWAGSTPGSTN